MADQDLYPVPSEWASRARLDAAGMTGSMAAAGNGMAHSVCRVRHTTRSK